MSFRQMKANEDGFSLYAEKIENVKKFQVFRHHSRSPLKLFRTQLFYPEETEPVHCYVLSSEKILKSIAYDKSL